MHSAGLSDRRGPSLVGRGRELAQLETALDAALNGRGGLVLLTGEPGIGKTALAREFVEHAATRGAAWAWGSCWDGGGAPAYWPWVQVARTLARGGDLAGLATALGAGAPWIAGLLPEFSATLGEPARASELDSDQARFRLFDALATLLATAAERQPLVVVLDDLHWADASSLLALEFVSRALPDVPLLAIAAYRHAEAHARPELAAALGGLARAATRLPLEGLGRDEVGELAAARARRLGGAGEPEPIPPQLVAAVHQASAGNPFFVDELVQLLAAQGRLHDGAAAAAPAAAARRRARRDPPPPRPAGAPRHAVARRRRRDRRRVSHCRRWPAWSTSPPPPCSPGSRRRCAAGWSSPAAAPGGFQFAHALVRDTLLESLGANRRARLHLLAAEALEEAYGDDLEPHLAEIAHHFLQAAGEGGAERAVDYAARAAQRAVGQFAYEEAARLYERAIDVSASLPADEPRAWQLAQGLGEARMRAGDVDGALRALRAASGHARRLDDPERLAQTALASTLGTFSPGLVDPELVAVLEEALARLDALTPTGLRAARDGRRAALPPARAARARPVLVAVSRAPRAARRRGARARPRDLQRRGGARLAGAADPRRPHAGLRARAGVRRGLGPGHRHARAADLDRGARALPAHERRGARHAGAPVADQPPARARRPGPRRRGDRGLRHDRAPPRAAADARLRPAAPRDGGPPARRLRRRRAVHRRGARALARRAGLDRADHRRRPDVPRPPHAGPPARARGARAPQRRPPAGDAPLALRPGARARRARPRGGGAPRARASRRVRLRRRPARRALARGDVAARRAVHACSTTARARTACTSCWRPTRAATSCRWAPPTSARSRATSACWR